MHELCLEKGKDKDRLKTRETDPSVSGPEQFPRCFSVELLVHLSFFPSLTRKDLQELFLNLQVYQIEILWKHIEEDTGKVQCKCSLSLRAR